MDLRLRPFGNAGPLASSKAQFVQYYDDEKGRSHPFERLAMVRLRWIAGDSDLGFEIEQLREKLLYEGQKIDQNAVWEISNKMRAQHARPGQLNSKHGPGGLADLEQTVQLLQLEHARQVPQLRTPRLHEAMNVLVRGGVVGGGIRSDFGGVPVFATIDQRPTNATRFGEGFIFAGGGVG